MQILNSNITLFVHIVTIPKKLFCIYNLVDADTCNQHSKVAYEIVYRIVSVIYNILLLHYNLLIFKYLQNVKCPDIQIFNTFFNT